jgi:hypothetical protein
MNDTIPQTPDFQIKKLRASGYKLWPGVRVTSIEGESDLDEKDATRETGPGATGWVSGVSTISGDAIWTVSVNFKNGTRVLLDSNELNDPTKYQLEGPSSARELALYIKHGFSQGYTIMDGALYDVVASLANSHDEIIKLADKDDANA